ncbi:MAG: aspartate/glutamate racemase family protein [Alphaproteobacteria bacterium]|nr:aspartate/glutamate racemase family protein [Alphaproteobacteria bacterium]
MRKPRLLLVNAFQLSAGSGYTLRPATGDREALVMDYANVAPHLADLDWDAHPGALATHGDHPVETREEFLIVGVNRIRVVREACESGRWDAIALLGGGDPGFVESVEIGRRFGVAVTSCAHAQMHLATMLGHRFGIVDISEVHNVRMAELVTQYRFEEHCTGIRNIDFPLPRPANDGRPSIGEERAKAQRGEASAMLDAAVAAAEVAIVEDGAESIILGCSAAYWMRPLLAARLHDAGWDAPVLEGFSCAIEMAKLLCGMRQLASGIAFPSDPPRRSRRWRPV